MTDTHTPEMDCYFPFGFDTDSPEYQVSLDSLVLSEQIKTPTWRDRYTLTTNIFSDVEMDGGHATTQIHTEYDAATKSTATTVALTTTTDCVVATPRPENVLVLINDGFLNWWSDSNVDDQHAVIFNNLYYWLTTHLATSGLARQLHDLLGTTGTKDPAQMQEHNANFWWL